MLNRYAAEQLAHSEGSGKRLKADASFALAADYCASRGIAYSAFLEWDDLSRDVALAWHARDRERCGGCGAVPSDWKAYDDDGNPILDDTGEHREAWPPKYVLEAHHCPACAALARAADDKDPPPGRRWYFRPTDA